MPEEERFGWGRKPLRDNCAQLIQLHHDRGASRHFDVDGEIAVGMNGPGGAGSPYEHDPGDRGVLGAGGAGGRVVGRGGGTGGPGDIEGGLFYTSGAARGGARVGIGGGRVL